MIINDNKITIPEKKSICFVLFIRERQREERERVVGTTAGGAGGKQNPVALSLFFF